MSKKIEKAKKIREVFTDELPHWRFGKSKPKGVIDWRNSVGYHVKGIYDDLEFEVEIIYYDSTTNKLSIKYKNEPVHKIFIGNFIKCKLEFLLMHDIYELRYNENNPRRVDLRNLPLNSKGINWYKIVESKIKIPFVYDDIEGFVEIVGYDGESLNIKYLDKKPFKMNAGGFTKCQLAGLLGIKTKEFKFEINDILKNDIRNLVLIDKEHRDNIYNTENKMWKWYKYKCNKCGHEDWMEESNVTKGMNCSACSSTHRTVVEYINSIVAYEETQWMIPYFQGGYDEAKQYTRYSREKIYPICPECGNVRDTPIVINNLCSHHSMGCKYCGDGISYPEKFMFNVLEQLNIEFIHQYIPDFIKPKKYDFYFELDDKKYIIETDGRWHKDDNAMSGQTAKESYEIDNYKDLKARENGIEPIRINCYESEMEYIRDKIIKSELNNLFHLDSVNWNKAEEYALSSRVKEACKIKTDNPNITNTEIGMIMKLHPTTISKYLVKGSKVWDWCNYNVKEERRKASSRNAKSKSKPLEMFENGISLGVFESGTELSRQSEDLFGVKLVQENISKACLENTKYKGYTFKYV